MRFEASSANGRQPSAGTPLENQAAVTTPRATTGGSEEEKIVKQRLVQEILAQIEYQSAWQQGLVEVGQDELEAELRQLSTRALVACREAFLLARSEWLYAGHEPNGIKIVDRPAGVIRKLMESDPNFDIHKYIF